MRNKQVLKIYAHRGSSLLWPENTLLAFDLAYQYGATGFETDLRLSQDKEIILSHDDNLARLGYPQYSVSQLTAEKILQITISSPDGQYRDRMIPLRDLLIKYPQKDYIFDCKIADERLFIQLQNLLKDLNFHDRIWFLTWSRRGDKFVKKYFPGYKYFPRELRTRIWGWASLLGLGNLLEPANEILSLPAFHLGRPLFTRSQIQNIKRRGKTFMGFLVNTEEELQYCLECGVEVVLTDRIDLMVNW